MERLELNGPLKRFPYLSLAPSLSLSFSPFRELVLLAYQSLLAF